MEMGMYRAVVSDRMLRVPAHSQRGEGGAGGRGRRRERSREGQRRGRGVRK